MTLKKISLYAAAAVLLGTSCSKQLDELLVNPNGPTPSQADVDLYLPTIQGAFGNMFSQASGFGREVTRQIVMYGPTYQTGYSPQSYDGLWNAAYTGVFKHANELIPVALDQKKFVQAGMTKVMKAYTMMTLVDIFGDIPYAEANLGSLNTNPAINKGADVYAAAIKLLNETISSLDSVADGKLAHGTYPGPLDNFFGASNATGARRWATTAKLMKLRALMTTRLVDANAKAGVEALLADPFVQASINTGANGGSVYDFELKFSQKQTNPNSRHPDYNNNYVATNSASDYIGTHFMFILAEQNGLFNNTESRNTSDPRTRYYFYRQRRNFGDVNVNSSSCSVSPPPAHYTAGMPYCLITPGGFWGRDHGDDSGIPPDANLRTTWGIYPAGGEFDANQSTSVALNRGGQGGGIHPLWQASFTEFLKAEAVLKLGVAGDARALMESGLRKSIAKVIGFPSTLQSLVTPIPLDLIPTTDRINAHVAKILAKYDAAATDNDKLNVVMNEFYIALWGNGMDAYNNYRRTGYPNNFQFTKLPDPGPFTRSMLYPSDYINLNQNAPAQKAVDKQVFWDTNPPGFIK